MYCIKPPCQRLLACPCVDSPSQQKTTIPEISHLQNTKTADSWKFLLLSFLLSPSDDKVLHHSVMCLTSKTIISCILFSYFLTPFLSKSQNPHLDFHVSVRQHHEEVIVGHPILFPQLTDKLLIHKIFILYHFHGLFIILIQNRRNKNSHGVAQHADFNFTLKERGRFIFQKPSSHCPGKIFKTTTMALWPLAARF